MNDASETLYRLKPVTYRHKTEIDVTQSLDYGLVAEEVASIHPNLVACGKDGQLETVHYAAVNAMLSPSVRLAFAAHFPGHLRNHRNTNPCEMRDSA